MGRNTPAPKYSVRQDGNKIRAVLQQRWSAHSLRATYPFPPCSFASPSTATEAMNMVSLSDTGTRNIGAYCPHAKRPTTEHLLFQTFNCSMIGRPTGASEPMLSAGANGTHRCCWPRRKHPRSTTCSSNIEPQDHAVHCRRPTVGGGGLTSIPSWS